MPGRRVDGQPRVEDARDRSDRRFKIRRWKLDPTDVEDLIVPTLDRQQAVLEHHPEVAGLEPSLLAVVKDGQRTLDLDVSDVASLHRIALVVDDADFDTLAHKA